MTIPPLGPLASLTLRKPAEAARQILALNPGREVLWLAFFLAVVLNCIAQMGIDMSIAASGGPTVSQSIPVVLIRSAGTMLFSILAFLYVGRFLGGTGRFEDLMILTIWLQFLQIAALVATLALSLIAVAFMAPLILATAIYSLYITLHFLNEAHKFGSLGKSFGVILLSALLAVPFVLFLSPLGPV